jgi:hypothetical protein
LTALLNPYDRAAARTSGPPRVAVNSEVSTETFVLTVRAPAVIPSTRSSCVLT